MKRVWLVAVVVLVVAVGYVCVHRLFIAPPSGGNPTRSSAPAEADGPYAGGAGREGQDRQTSEGQAAVPAEATVPASTLVDDQIEDLSEKAADELDVNDSIAKMKRYWRAEDDMLARMPKYDAVKDDYRKKAAEALEAVDAADPKAVIALAGTELDRFWAKGSLQVEDSYAHAWLARAVIELSLEKDPDNFQLLCALKESVSAVTPLFDWERKPNTEGIELLWGIVNKQKALIEAGTVAPSIDSMKAMCDWANLNYRKTGDAKAAAPVWQWLIDNADAGGWSKIVSGFRAGLKAAGEGEIYIPSLNITPYGPTPKDIERQERMMNKYGRRLTSLAGGEDWRKTAIPAWEAPGN